MISILPHIAIDEGEIGFDFIRSSGPGGQNVNKVASAVQLRFDVRRSPSLPDAVRWRVERLAGRRLNGDGVLVITAHRHRSQEQNRQDAIERLIDLVRRAATPPAKRHPTKPTAGSLRRLREAKLRRSAIKRTRTDLSGADD